MSLQDRDYVRNHPFDQRSTNAYRRRNDWQAARRRRRIDGAVWMLVGICLTLCTVLFLPDLQTVLG